MEGRLQPPNYNAMRKQRARHTDVIEEGINATLDIGAAVGERIATAAAEWGKPKRVQVAALWKHRTSRGGTYYRGSILSNGLKVPVYGFDNSWQKQNERQPDIRIYLREVDTDTDWS